MSNFFQILHILYYNFLYFHSFIKFKVTFTKVCPLHKPRSNIYLREFDLNYAIAFCLQKIVGFHCYFFIDLFRTLYTNLDLSRDIQDVKCCVSILIRIVKMCESYEQC